MYRLLSGQVQAAKQSVTMRYPGPSLMNLTGAKCIFSQLLEGGGGYVTSTCHVICTHRGKKKKASGERG